MPADRRHRAGDSIEDHCRACHEDRTHAVIAVDGQGVPLRVHCKFCGSQHNYRGGPRTVVSTSTAPRPRVTELDPPTRRYEPEPRPRRAEAPPPRPAPPSASPSPPPLTRPSSQPSSPATRERSEPAMTTSTTPHDDLERLLRRVLREESGLTPVAPAEKWRGGELVLKPGRPGVQGKSWPIETFFHKIVMVRNRLRTLEQQMNASDLPADQKLKLQSYVTGCYGSLTSFNILFADDDDRFVGSGQD